MIDREIARQRRQQQARRLDAIVVTVAITCTLITLILAAELIAANN